MGQRGNSGVWFFQVPSISDPIMHSETSNMNTSAYELTGYTVSHIWVDSEYIM